nr:hypothetical protein BHI3_07520 [Bacteriovorax sp. HI3]
MTSWQKYRAIQTGELQNYCTDIEDKLEVALKALGEVSQGYGTGKDSNHVWNIQRLASNAIVKIGQMKQRDKPFIWWSEK